MRMVMIIKAFPILLRLARKLCGHNLVAGALLVLALSLWWQKKGSQLAAGPERCQASWIMDQGLLGFPTPDSTQSLYDQAFLADVVVWIKKQPKVVSGELQSGRSYRLARAINVRGRHMVSGWGGGQGRSGHQPPAVCVMQAVEVRVQKQGSQVYLGFLKAEDLQHLRLTEPVYLLPEGAMDTHDVCFTSRIRYHPQ